MLGTQLMLWLFIVPIICTLVTMSYQYRCYIFGNVNISKVQFKTHLYVHQHAAEIQLPIMCLQGSCNASFCKIYNFMRHIDKYHSSDKCRSRDLVIANSNTDTDVVDDQFDTTQNESHCSIYAPENAACTLNDIRAQGVTLVAGLRANSSMPYNVIPYIINSVSEVASSVLSYTEAAIKHSLEQCGLATDVALSVQQSVHEQVEQCRQPLDFLSSVYKQDRFFQDHPLFVAPESVCFGARYESHGGHTKLVYDTFQYVSVQKTIACLLKNQQYVETLLHDKRVPGIYADFADGAIAAEHVLFSRRDKFSLMIQLFYDGLGTTNPLRSQSTVNNIGVFYFTVKNLPNKHNSCFPNVHLLALTYSQDLKTYGFDPILDKFVAEMNDLEKVGVEAVLPVLGCCRVFASLCQVTCDNLALNSMLGFIESFSSDYFCTVCYATQQSIQTCYRSELFERRSVAKYNEDVSAIADAVSRGKSHARGVKRYCRLNEINGYHVTENWGLDIMHIILEGIVPIEIGCVLYGLCEDQLLDIDTINADVELFWGHLTVHRNEKPPSLNKVSEPGCGLSPSMKAAQLWSLVRYLPLAIGKRIPGANKHWLFLLHLCCLVDLIFAPRFTRGMIAYLKDVIEDHLVKFCDLYKAGWHVKLRPKHHLLVHLPDIILRSGPLIGMSCMKYELKNSFLKRSAHTVCNFTNICQTLAKRHQQQSLFHMLSGLHIRNVPSIQQATTVPVCTLAYCDLVCSQFSLEPTDDILIANRAYVATLTYVRGNLVVVDFQADTGDPVFGRILSFICCSQSDWHIVVELLVTEQFCSHVHAFRVSDKHFVEYKTVKFESLVDHHPLHCCTLLKGAKYVRLPYVVFHA